MDRRLGFGIFSMEKPSNGGSNPSGSNMKIVSACLAGVNCRYDGKNSANQKVIDLVRQGKAIPVCPEQLGGLPTPRENSEIRQGRVITVSGKDETEQLQKGAEEALKIARLVGAKEAIFKSKSPSCGKGKVYDGSFSGKLVEGNGIATDLIEKNGLKVVSEEGL